MLEYIGVVMVIYIGYSYFLSYNRQDTITYIELTRRYPLQIENVKNTQNTQNTQSIPKLPPAS